MRVMPEESITISSDVSPAEQLSTNGILNFNQGLANILAIEQLGKPVTYSPAPEPGSVILLSSGLGALAIIRIRQRASDLLAFEIFSALTVDLAGALTIARTQPRSTGQMRGIGESTHVQPQLRDQRSGRNALLRPGSAPSCGRGFTSSIREPAIPYIPARLPVHAGRFHGHVRDVVGKQPQHQPAQVIGECPKLTLLLRLPARFIEQSQIRHHRLLMYIPAAATAMHCVHTASFCRPA